jgi:hypothetical protein
VLTRLRAYLNGCFSRYRRLAKSSVFGEFSALACTAVMIFGKIWGCLFIRRIKKAMNSSFIAFLYLAETRC